MVTLFVMTQMEDKMSHLPDVAYYMLSGVFIFLMFIIFGYKLFGFIEHSLYIGKTDGFKDSLVIILLVASIVRLLCACSFSYVVREETASFFIEKNKDAEYNAKIEKANSERSAQIAEAKADKEKAESSEEKRIRDVKKQWKVDYQAAVNSGSPDQIRSWKASNETGGWLMTSGKKNKEYANGVLAVKNALPALIEAEKEKTRVAAGGFVAVNEDKLLKTEIEELQRQRTAKQEEIKQDLVRKSNYVFIVDILAGSFGFLFTFLTVLLLIKSKKNLDTRTIHSALSLVFASWEKRIIHRIESWAKVDLDDDGHIGTPPVGAPEPAKAPEDGEEDIFTMLEKSQKVDAKKELANIEKARKEAAEFNARHHDPAVADYLRNREKAPGVNGHHHGEEDGKKKA
jgi:hypothetical protein